jgi:hypothetical protein
LLGSSMVFTERATPVMLRTSAQKLFYGSEPSQNGAFSKWSILKIERSQN